MHRVLNPLVFSNTFTATAVALLCASTYWRIPDLQWDYSIIFITWGGTFCYYNLHRWFKVGMAPEVGLTERHTWIANNWKVHRPLVILVGLSILAVLAFNPHLLYWYWPALAVALGYSFPFTTKAGQKFRLRDIPFIKPLIIAACVVYCANALPILARGLEWNEKIWLSLLDSTLLIVMLTIPFELRDVQVDGKEGLTTLATRWKESSVHLICYLLAVFWALGHVLILSANGSPSLFTMASTLAFLAIYVGLVRMKTYRDERLATLTFEGLIVVYAVSWVQ
jgi:4-hydroxybenzoate polyprenyltransferase